MEYKEKEIEEMKFVGIGIDTSVQKSKEDCPVVWQEFMKNYKKIENYMGGMKNYGVAFEQSKDDCTFHYTACAEVSDFGLIEEGMEKVQIPKSKCLVFIHKGKLDKLGETYWAITKELENKNIKAKPFWFELYDKRWVGDLEKSEMEIWIPIE